METPQHIANLCMKPGERIKSRKGTVHEVSQPLQPHGFQVRLGARLGPDTTKGEEVQKHIKRRGGGETTERVGREAPTSWLRLYLATPDSHSVQHVLLNTSCLEAAKHLHATPAHQVVSPQGAVRFLAHSRSCGAQGPGKLAPLGLSRRASAACGACRKAPTGCPWPTGRVRGPVRGG